MSTISRRRIFLINKEFQLRFAFYVSSWLIALSIVYPMIITNIFEYLFRYLALDPLGPALSTLESTKKDLLWLLMFLQGVLVLLTFAISIFMSHKIAGPLYKLKRFFQDVKNGNYEQVLSFREKDYFQELVPAFNEMMQGVRVEISNRDEKMKAAEQSLAEMLDKAPAELKPQIKKIIQVLR